MFDEQSDLLSHDVISRAIEKFERNSETCRRTSILDRILSRVRIDPEITHSGTPCWLWDGPTSGEGRGGGYGRMSLNGQTVATHIVMFTHFYGFVPGKKQIDHQCRRRLCCNPLHLEMVSHKTNQKRRAKAQKEAK